MPAYNRSPLVKCRVCHCAIPKNALCGKEELYLCPDCDERFFSDLYTDEEKIDRLIVGLTISQANNMGIGLALNVARKRYSLEEARRRQWLKDRERSGKSVDVFTVGRRLPGGYK